MTSFAFLLLFLSLSLSQISLTMFSLWTFFLITNSHFFSLVCFRSLIFTTELDFVSVRPSIIAAACVVSAMRGIICEPRDTIASFCQQLQFHIDSVSRKKIDFISFSHRFCFVRTPTNESFNVVLFRIWSRRQLLKLNNYLQINFKPQAPFIVRLILQWLPFESHLPYPLIRIHQAKPVPQLSQFRLHIPARIVKRNHFRDLCKTIIVKCQKM